jgi:hypothetical protein
MISHVIVELKTNVTETCYISITVNIERCSTLMMEAVSEMLVFDLTIMWLIAQ